MEPADFAYGNAGRNIIIAPGTVNFDFSVARDFRIAEETRLEFRTEIFNLANSPQFWPPENKVGQGDFGKLTAIRGGSNRQIQLALKLYF